MKNEQAIQTLQQRFTDFERGLNGASSTPFHARRKEAFARFIALGFPTLRDEEWRFTSLTPLLGSELSRPVTPSDQLLASIDVASYLPGIENAYRMVFVDGYHIPALSGPESSIPGVAVMPLSTALGKHAETLLERSTGIDDSGDNPFSAMNFAFAEEGAFLHVSPNTVCERPVHLLFLTSSDDESAAYPRIHIRAERGSEISVIEQHVGLGGGAYFRNVVTDSVVEEDAHVRVYKLQEESVQATHIASSYARVARGGSYHNHYFGFGGSIVRNNLHTEFGDEHAECTMNGLYIPMNTQHMDHHTVIDHAHANCNSHELYKGILLDNARGVFSGRIIVRKGAQKTDAKQSNNNLLLSENAQIDTKPQLEIWADDVKCTHGATIGRIDEDALFYLRTRGISSAQAHRMLSHAFASELLSHVQLPALRDHVDSAIHLRLERNGMES